MDVFFILFKWRTVHPLLLMRGLCSVFEVFSLESGVVAPFSSKLVYSMGRLLIPYYFPKCIFFSLYSLNQNTFFIYHVATRVPMVQLEFPWCGPPPFIFSPSIFSKPSFSESIFSRYIFFKTKT